MVNFENPNKMVYRPYIDGLRGIAIIAVVLYHAELFSFTGGFIGVDVFFVISGFLITSIIIKDINTGTFSLLQFWERRIRRIVPVLFVVLLSTIVASYYLILYPQDYYDFGNSLIYQGFFSSNILFMSTDNYFEQLSKMAPLLHTWSLSVEEQFYVAFPFIVLFCVWFSRRLTLATWAKSISWKKILVWTVIFIGSVSFFISVWLVDLFPTTVFGLTTNQSAGFYLLASRAWEIALGVIVAIFAIKIKSKKNAEIMSYVGIFALIVSSIYYHPATNFPGISALLPTLGAVLIIISNESHKTFIGKILSYPKLVWVGLISFSLYLWHWPVFVFAKFIFTENIKIINLLGLILLSVFLSWITYKYIETPFRKKILLPNRKHMFILGISCLVVLISIGQIIKVSSNKISNRIPEHARNVLLASEKNVLWGEKCFRIPQSNPDFEDVCFIGTEGTELSKRFVLWGDSHAEALSPMFDSLGKKYLAQGAVFTNGSCVPIFGVHQIPETEGCRDKNEDALNYIYENDIKHIILIARWSYYVRGGPNNIKAALITDSSIPSVSHEESSQVFERNLLPMIKKWSEEGRVVYIMKQVPEQRYNLRDAFYEAVNVGVNVKSQGVTRDDHEEFQLSTNSIIDKLANLKGVHVIDPAKIFCKNKEYCSLEIEGKLIYRDEDHMSTFGGVILEPLFVSGFK